MLGLAVLNVALLMALVLLPEPRADRAGGGGRSGTGRRHAAGLAIVTLAGILVGGLVGGVRAGAGDSGPASPPASSDVFGRAAESACRPEPGGTVPEGAGAPAPRLVQVSGSEHPFADPDTRRATEDQ